MAPITNLKSYKPNNPNSVHVLLSSSKDGSIFVYEIDRHSNLKKILIFDKHLDSVTSLEILKACRLLSNSSTETIDPSESNQSLPTAEKNDDKEEEEDLFLVVSGGMDYSILIWDPTNGEIYHKLLHRNPSWIR
jgi:WD40 repeat protein